MLYLLLWAMAALPQAQAAPQLSAPPGFVIYSTDNTGGGWVIHHLSGRGDSLWGCADVTKAPTTCIQVFFEAWRTGTQLSFLHVGQTTQDGWLKLHAPGWGDALLACYDPETKPQCKAVALDLRPPEALLSRAWPAYSCKDPTLEAHCVIEQESHAEMWLQAGASTPGPLNLYACLGLQERDPRCRVGLPNLLRIEREPLGFRRLDDMRPHKGEPSIGVRIDKLDAESAAWAAGIRPQMIIVGIGGFPATHASKFLELSKQYPAGTSFEVLMRDGKSYQVTPRRRSDAR